MERDTLNAQNKQQKKEISLLRYTKLPIIRIHTLCNESMYFTLEITSLKLFSAQLINTEQERDKLSIEINRLGMQCQHLKSTQERLVAEHSKTLERINELWKQKWPGAFDEVSRNICMKVCSDNGFVYFVCSKPGKRSTSLSHWYVMYMQAYRQCIIPGHCIGVWWTSWIQCGWR